MAGLANATAQRLPHRLQGLAENNRPDQLLASGYKAMRPSARSAPGWADVGHRRFCLRWHSYLPSALPMEKNNHSTDISGYRSSTWRWMSSTAWSHDDSSDASLSAISNNWVVVASISPASIIRSSPAHSCRSPGRRPTLQCFPFGPAALMPPIAPHAAHWRCRSAACPSRPGCHACE